MNIQTKVIPITWLHGIRHGYGCGYIGVPKEHPFYGKSYDDIHNEYEGLSVHGGLTYSEDKCPSQEPDGNWWIGFDCAHGGDNQLNCNELYVKQEVENLKKFALSIV